MSDTVQIAAWEPCLNGLKTERDVSMRTVLADFLRLLPRVLRGMLERATHADALFAEQERAQVTLNSIGDAVVSVDVHGRVTYLNAVAQSMTGWSYPKIAS